MTDFVLVLSTWPAGSGAPEPETLARTLVEERLVACVNVLAPMQSFYEWKGELQRDAERQIVIKTTRDRVDALRERLHALHPYEVPEFLVIDVAGGSEAYLAWVRESVSA